LRFVIAAAFHWCCSIRYAQSHLTALPVKQWPTALPQSSIDQLQVLGEQAVVLWLTMQQPLSVFFMETCVPKVLNMINYIVSPHLELSNGKLLFLQEETMPYVSGFPLSCCAHSYIYNRFWLFWDKPD
jgi:hypothetical protein